MEYSISTDGEKFELPRDEDYLKEYPYKGCDVPTDKGSGVSFINETLASVDRRQNESRPY